MMIITIYKEQQIINKNVDQSQNFNRKRGMLKGCNFSLFSFFIVFFYFNSSF